MFDYLINNIFFLYSENLSLKNNYFNDLLKLKKSINFRFLNIFVILLDYLYILFSYKVFSRIVNKLILIINRLLFIFCVKKIAVCVGDHYNQKYHSVFLYKNTFDNSKKMCIFKVLCCGYVLNDFVIRKSSVIVYNVL